MVCTALDSVWNQTYRPLELIIVDDGSKDNSMEVIEDWRGHHPDGNGFTSVAKSFPNGKLCVARNRGLAMAHGEYIQYVDDDDWLYPEAIARKMAYTFTHPELDLIVNQLDYICDGKKINHTRITLPQHGENLIAWLLDDHECLISPVLMFKTETLRQIGAWKEGLIFADDMEITTRMAINGCQFGLVDERLSAYCIHSKDRQCTTVRERLPDDFTPRLYEALRDLAIKRGALTVEVNSAFADALMRNALSYAKHGKFKAAELCMESSISITEPNYLREIICHLALLNIYWRILFFLQLIKSFLKRIRHCLS